MPIQTQYSRRPLRAYAVLLAISLVALSGCDYADNDDAGETPPAVTTDAIVHVPVFIEDADGNAPSDPATPLFENRKHNPVLAPNGESITLAAFNRVAGTVQVNCVDEGTLVRLDLSGLIPNGIYTIWNVVFEAPGFEPTFAHMTGLGTLGPPNGTQNTFLASIDGKATIEATTPEGPLSMFGDIGGCALTDEFEWHIVGAYHLDAQTHGPDLGPDGTAVEQFAFAFTSE